MVDGAFGYILCIGLPLVVAIVLVVWSVLKKRRKELEPLGTASKLAGEIQKRKVRFTESKCLELLKLVETAFLSETTPSASFTKEDHPEAYKFILENKDDVFEFFSNRGYFPKHIDFPNSTYSRFSFYLEDRQDYDCYNEFEKNRLQPIVGLANLPKKVIFSELKEYGYYIKFKKDYKYDLSIAPFKAQKSDVEAQ